MADVCGVNPSPEKALESKTTIGAAPERVWRALTEPAELREWWAEARVDLPAGVFELWGESVPGMPAEPATQLQSYADGSMLNFSWPMYGAPTTATIRLAAAGDGTLVTVDHVGMRHSDLWIVMLENLRLHCLGEPVQRYAFRPVSAVHAEVQIAAAPAEVFAALLDPKVLDRFWATGAQIEPAVGGKLDYGWGGGPLKILELEPDSRLSISWQEGPDDPETLVTWQLAGSGGETRLTLTHSGFAQDTEVDGLDIGWFGFLLQLRALLELGPRWERVTPRSYTVEPAAAA